MPICIEGERRTLEWAEKVMMERMDTELRADRLHRMLSRDDEFFYAVYGIIRCLGDIIR